MISEWHDHTRACEKSGATLVTIFRDGTRTREVLCKDAEREVQQHFIDHGNVSPIDNDAALILVYDGGSTK